MVAKKKRECSFKDRSPLGLVGILLITAGAIIAIYDVKDALPNDSASYVVVIGVILILLGVLSIVLAFLGYRRSRASLRETNGKVKGHCERKFQRRQFRRVSSSSSMRSGFNRKDEQQDMSWERMDGPSLVSLPQSYHVTIPSQNGQNFRSATGNDNYGFEKSPAHVPTYTILDNLGNYPANARSPRRQAYHENISVFGSVVDQTRLDGTFYSPPLPNSTSAEVATYMPPVGTTV